MVVFLIEFSVLVINKVTAGVIFKQFIPVVSQINIYFTKTPPYTTNLTMQRPFFFGFFEEQTESSSSYIVQLVSYDVVVKYMSVSETTGLNCVTTIFYQFDLLNDYVGGRPNSYYAAFDIMLCLHGIQALWQGVLKPLLMLATVHGKEQLYQSKDLGRISVNG